MLPFSPFVPLFSTIAGVLCFLTSPLFDTMQHLYKLCRLIFMTQAFFTQRLFNFFISQQLARPHRRGRTALNSR
jgi:hypothetical protein